MNENYGLELWVYHKQLNQSPVLHKILNYFYLFCTLSTDVYSFETDIKSVFFLIQVEGF